MNDNVTTVPADLVGQMLEKGARLAFERSRIADDDPTFEAVLTYAAKRGDPLQELGHLRQGCEEALEDRAVLDDPEKRIPIEVTYSALSAIEKLFGR